MIMKTLYPEPKHFIAKAAVEGSDEGVLLRLFGIGAVSGSVVLLGRCQQDPAGELGAPARDNDPLDRCPILVER